MRKFLIIVGILIVLFSGTITAVTERMVISDSDTQSLAASHKFQVIGLIVSLCGLIYPFKEDEPEENGNIKSE